LDAPAGAVIGVPGKAERCGSNSTCALQGETALRAAARTARTARTARKEAQRCMAP